MNNNKKTTTDRPEQLLTIPDVATLSQVSPKTVRRWIEAGELLVVKLGNQWRIRPTDFEYFVRDRLAR